MSPSRATDRFDALKAGKVDLLSRNSTWTHRRARADLGLVFTGVTYYDGQGFMVKRARGKTSALELDGATVCVQAGTTTEPNFVDYFTTNTMKYTEVSAATPAEVLEAYESGKCDTITTDVSQLYAKAANLTQPATIHPARRHLKGAARPPCAATTTTSGSCWCSGCMYAMVNAEELGVSSGSHRRGAKSKKPDVMRLIGTDGDFGEQARSHQRLDRQYRQSVGNYGEVYERNVGVEFEARSIPRGLNQLWSNGGIQYAPPIR